MNKILSYLLLGPALIGATLWAANDFLPTPPPLSLTTLTPIRYTVGWGDRLLINSSLENLPVELEGKPCSTYILAHAASVILYDIPPGAVLFTAKGIASQGIKNPGTWSYKVKIDGLVAFESHPLYSYPDHIVPITVRIPAKAQILELIIQSVGSLTYAHSIWAMPQFEFKLPAAPPVPSPETATSPRAPVSLVGLPPIKYSVGWADLMMNASEKNLPVEIEGKPCPTYIFAHAPSSLLYDIPPGTVAFTAKGISPQGLKNPGSWLYRVKIDSEIVFESSALSSYPDHVVPIRVPIPTQAKKIELLVDPMGNATQDHSIWAFPQFELRE